MVYSGGRGVGYGGVYFVAHREASSEGFHNPAQIANRSLLQSSRAAISLLLCIVIISVSFLACFWCASSLGSPWMVDEMCTLSVGYRVTGSVESPGFKAFLARKFCSVVLYRTSLGDKSSPFVNCC